MEENASGGESILGQIAEGIVSAAAAVGDFVVNDPGFQTAGAQGLEELGNALQPLPDSVQATSQNNLWGYDGPTPSEIASSETPYVAGQDQGMGQDQDFSY